MRLACVQANVVFGDPAANAARAVEKLKELKAQGVDLAVFPEAYLTGYCVNSEAAAREIALKDFENSQPTLDLRQACEDLDMLAVVGFASQGSDGTLRNSAALFEPGVEPRFYHKTHLPELGLDKFVRTGDAIRTFDTRLGRLGILICFDMRLPEPTRELVLQGADVIILPTNWPEGSGISSQHICITRAAENKVFFAACNRVGKENGFAFIGGSKIVSPVGNVLAAAGPDEETIVADLDLAEARDKRSVIVPGAFELEILGTRRPELYQSLGSKV